MKRNIIVGSISKHKLQAVERACKEIWTRFKMTGVETDSGQNEQPIGLEETLAGALTRAKWAQKENPQAIAIGIESGILRTSNPISISIDLAVIVVLFKNYKIITTSTGMQFPEECVNMAEEIGFKKCTAGSLIGDGEADPHYTISNATVSRQETLTSGIIIAMRQIAYLIK